MESANICRERDCPFFNHVTGECENKTSDCPPGVGDYYDEEDDE